MSKRVLVTGKNSYIGTAFKEYIENISNDYIIETIDTYNFDNASYNFRGCDAVICVAGIVHIKETRKNKEMYYKINSDLPLKIAAKAKSDGVKQFIFLSTMSVYGKTSGIITPDTVPTPNSNYGKSKLQAENMLLSLENNFFKIVIIRPPMVYGKNCKGNFQTVVKLVKALPIFPKIKNRRSMIYIENLCEFMRLCIEEERAGLFFPQNKEYVETSKMAEIIAEKLNKKVFLSRILGFAVYLIRPFVKIANKAFGNLIYQETEKDNYNYCVIDEIDSFKKSV